MAGWYIRRGEKVVGPVDINKLRELVAAGRLVPTDQLAKDAAGPWTQAARTNLFAKAPDTSLPVAPQKPSVNRQSPVAVTREPEEAIQQRPPQTQVVEAPASAKSKFGILASTGRAVSRAVAERSKRKHELKLAKINAQALVEAQRANATPRPTQPANAPAAPQSINVNVVQQVNVGSRKRWSRLVAMFLSFLIPGLGQLYKGQPINGLVWFVLTVAGYVFLIVPGIVLHCLCILGAAMGDPYR